MYVYAYRVEAGFPSNLTHGHSETEACFRGRSDTFLLSSIASTFFLMQLAIPTTS